jgi:L-lactate dehydrogenase complex protein LldF
MVSAQPTTLALPVRPSEPLPAEAFDFEAISSAAAANEPLKRAVSGAVLRQYIGRQQQWASLPDVQALRELAAQIKQHTLDHLDWYVQQFAANVRANGGQVHFAADGDEARRIILRIAQDAGCRRCIKAKSMVSEEISLAEHLEAGGLEVCETDLGEFIVQIGHDRPSHLVTPIIHKDRAAIARLFSEYFKTPYDDDPQALAMQARRHLRDKFRRADLGLTGGNFMVAETGQLCCVENEGNQRHSISSPRVLISLVGIEKMVPRLTDLAVLLKLLARSATGQPLTVYTNLFGGPRGPGQSDGPEQFHVVLVDNGRSGILQSQYRPTLRCIRCGACLNACPVYRSIGGHAYGSVYPGPIGALITPLLQGIERFADLPKASSLCGACGEACPVKIDIPHFLVQLRRDMVSAGLDGRIERFIYRSWALSMRWMWSYRLSSWLQKVAMRRRARATGWISKMPLIIGRWTKVRDLPPPAPRPFRAIWNDRKAASKE